MVKFLKRYLPWAMIAFLVLNIVAGLLGVPFLSIQLVNVLAIIGWISYIEIAQFDTEG